MNLINIKGKWELTERTITLKKYDYEVRPYIEMKAETALPVFETDIIVIQEPYQRLKKVITYSPEYLRDVGEKRHILGMYSELMDKYPDKVYILISKVIEDLEPRYFRESDRQITYEWVIK